MFNFTNDKLKFIIRGEDIYIYMYGKKKFHTEDVSKDAI